MDICSRKYRSKTSYVNLVTNISVTYALFPFNVSVIVCTKMWASIMVGRADMSQSPFSPSNLPKVDGWRIVKNLSLKFCNRMRKCMDVYLYKIYIHPLEIKLIFFIKRHLTTRVNHARVVNWHISDERLELSSSYSYEPGKACSIHPNKYE